MNYSIIKDQTRLLIKVISLNKEKIYHIYIHTQIT